MRDLSNYRNEYLTNSGFESTLVEYRSRIVLEQLSRYKAKRILEVGCGILSLAESYSHFEAFYVVEPIAEFIEIAKARLLHHPRQPIFKNAPVQEFAKGTQEHFDFIVVSSLLHELEDKESLVLAIKKLAKRDTIIHFNVPNALSLHNRLAVKMGILANEFELSQTAKSFQRNSTFSLNTLSSYLEGHGFEILDSRSYFLKPFSNKQMQFLKDHSELFPSELFNSLFEISLDLPGLGAEIFVNAKLRT